jgi:bifunctional non-homologous end joining protein LigD
MARIKVEITHPDRVLFPADGITKADLVDYYDAVAEVMLPHVKGRPLTLWRYPRGIDEQGFVQQDFAGSVPDWMSSAEVAKEGGTVVHPIADRREALVWLANQNCITPHSWLSRRDRLDEPDLIVFDLDPSTTAFAPVRAAARACADVLEDLGLASYVKTTGSRGLHVVVPLSRGADFDTVRQFARDIAGVVAADDPAHRTAAQGQAGRSDIPRRDAQRLRADRGGAIRRARPPWRPGGHAAGVGRVEQPRPAARSVHDPRCTERDCRTR